MPFERPELELFHPTAEQLRRRAGPDVEVSDRDGVLLTTRARADPWASRVYQTRWTDENAEDGISAVIAFFEERARPFVWTVTPQSTPASLAERLARRGLVRELVGRMLLAPLPLAKVRPNADVRIEEITARSQMLTALRVQHPNHRR